MARSNTATRTLRSRNGCINCRKAKVKCDEIKPRCGTCHRRRAICNGYVSAQSSGRERHRSCTSTPGSSTATGTGGYTPECPEMPADSTRYGSPVSPASHHSQARYIRSRDSTPIFMPVSPGKDITTLQPLSMRIPIPGLKVDPLYTSLSLIPPGIIPAADHRNIELYFSRHPQELAMGEEFVIEMNTNALILLQKDPETVTDALAAIGYAYNVGSSAGSDMMVLHRRGRILANLRQMKPSGSYFEMSLHLLLILCAMELVTFAQPRQAPTIPMLLSNVSALIAHHLLTSAEISSMGRYFMRGLARQDLVVSLVTLRRFQVPTRAWLGPEDSLRPDRVLGYTSTLMPLLEELCALAEDLRDHIFQSSSAKGRTYSNGDTTWEMLVSKERADSLTDRLSSWQPPSMGTLPFRRTRKFHAQAVCYQAGARLYLHRIVHPPVSGAARTDTRDSFTFSESDTATMGRDEADASALQKAHQILLCANALPATDVKLLLWPVFLAACEMEDKGDRESILEIFDSILDHRKTITAMRTRTFVEDIVWPARDRREEWNWMILAQRYPGECLPI